jgi:hypothetical protein
LTAKGAKSLRKVRKGLILNDLSLCALRIPNGWALIGLMNAFEKLGEKD